VAYEQIRGHMLQSLAAFQELERNAEAAQGAGDARRAAQLRGQLEAAVAGKRPHLDRCAQAVQSLHERLQDVKQSLASGAGS
jgi:polyhydroxyalkanoate synthesis regulator phasin